MLSCFRHVKQSCPNPVEFSPVLEQNAYLIASRFKTHSLQTTTIFFFFFTWGSVLFIMCKTFIQISFKSQFSRTIRTAQTVLHFKHCFCGRKKESISFLLFTSVFLYLHVLVTWQSLVLISFIQEYALWNEVNNAVDLFCLFLYYWLMFITF